MNHLKKYKMFESININQDINWDIYEDEIDQILNIIRDICPIDAKRGGVDFGFTSKNRKIIYIYRDSAAIDFGLSYPGSEKFCEEDEYKPLVSEIIDRFKGIGGFAVNHAVYINANYHIRDEHGNITPDLTTMSLVSNLSIFNYTQEDVMKELSRQETDFVSADISHVKILLN